MRTKNILVFRSCIKTKGEVFAREKLVLFPTDCSKAVPLLQFIFVCTSANQHVVFVLFLFITSLSIFFFFFFFFFF